jgi:hypothetical protein
MVMVWLQALLLKASSLVPGKLHMLTRKLIPCWRTPKLLRRLIRPRCETVECGIIERNFYKKYFGPFEASYIS